MNIDEKSWQIFAEVFGLTMPSDSVPENSAILVLPGYFQRFRITEVKKYWPSKARYLWIAPTRGDSGFTLGEIAQCFACEAREGDIAIGDFARHTQEQMIWALKLLVEKPKVDHIMVSTASYHLPRATLTFLRAMNEAGL